MNLLPFTNLSHATNGLQNIRVGVIIRPHTMFPELMEQRNGASETTPFDEGFDHEIVDEQRGVLDVVEDSKCIVKVLDHTKGHELVERVSVLLKAHTE
ncbi:hypothetical protein SESBI_34772 [Sesbania bispinosa]|nr:hypothetical protein SESBI_34772 [Sesbania bispinosa]